MSKSERTKRQSARERIAEQQAAARRAESRRRLLIAGGAVVVVIVVVVVLVVVKLGQGSGSSGGGNGAVTGTSQPASVTKDVTTVPAATLNAVGTGSVLQATSTPVTKVTGPALTSHGKPEMLYIGAEFCPYCAAMRWSMAVALSRFGTLSTPLRGIRSSSTDSYPNTATLTFYKTSYTSKYLAFTPVENETRTRGPLQNTTSQEQQLWERYSPSGQTGYPFIDIGNRYTMSVIYNPGVLAGLNWQQIAADLHNPSSPVAQGALGAANFITAAICKTTGGQPGNVCTASGVTKAAAHL
jgi:hypothetical protein